MVDNDVRVIAYAGASTPGEEIRHFIIQNVENHAADIARQTALKFKISRQAVNKHLKILVAEHALAEQGPTRSRVYRLAPLVEWRKQYQISPELAEDQAWINDVLPA
jgi:predicted ArsR family transcriptional regulator